MTTQMHTTDVWPRLRKLSQRSGRKYVAVPFLGAGAHKRLMLRQGDTLVVRFDMLSIKAGLTDPREVLYYLRKRVLVHSVDNLHAKVFVFGHRAIVGSPNISQSSERSLIEAALETTDSATVKKAIAFVKSLRGDIVEPQYARGMVRYYNPPRGGKRKPPPPPPPKQSALWAVPLVRGPWDDEDYRQEKYAKAEAKKRLQRPRSFSVEDFLWWGDRFLNRVKRGQRIMMCTSERNKTMVSPPARVLVIRPYTYRRTRRAIICIAVRNSIRSLEFHRFLQKLGDNKEDFQEPNSPRLIRNALLAYRIGAVWPDLGEEK